MHRRAVWIATIALSLGCAESLEGPAPALAPAQPGEPADPAYVCGEQLTTAVTLTGSGFAPLVRGLPEATRTELPTVTLNRSMRLDGNPADGPAVVFDGADASSTALTWQSQGQMTMTIDPTLALAAGLYDIAVVNPQGAQFDQAAPLAVIDAPELAETTPGITCLAQGPRALSASGASFLQIGDATPTVQIGDADLPIDALDDCIDIPHPSLPGRLCETANLTVPADAVPPGYPALVVHNPQTAACDSEETVNLRVVPPPSLERVDPPLACPVEGDRQVVLHGVDFLAVDGALPAVTMTLANGEAVELDVLGVGACQALETTGHTVERCAQVTTVVPQQVIDAPYKPTIEITNPAPAGCLSTSSTALTLVPLPTVDAAGPPLACTGQSDRDIELTGSDLLVVDGATPLVSVAGRDVEVIERNDCVDLQVAGLPTETCSAVTVRVPEDHPMVAAGGFQQPVVRVENPQPAGCATEVTPLTITPPPVAEVVEPPIVCLEQGPRDVQLTGSGLLRVDGAGAVVTIGGTAVAATYEGCTAVPVAGLPTESCAEATLELPQGIVPAGHQPVQIANPDPAGCTSEEDLRLRVVPAPRIDRATPAVACIAEGPRAVVLEGAQFLTIDGVLPAVVMTDPAGAEVPLTVDGVDGCEAIDANQVDAQTCTRVTIAVPQALLADVYQPTITLTNPAPAGCAASASTSLLLAPPPTIAEVTPQFLCRNVPEVRVDISGDFLTIDGAAPAVRIGEGVALEVIVADCQAVEADNAVVERCARLEARFAPADFAPSERLSVTNPAPAGCSATREQQVVIVDPPVVRTAEPGLLCTQDGARQVIVEGENFLRINGVGPSVRIGDQVGPADGVEGCEPAAEGALMWERCTRVIATLPQGVLPAGRPLVEVIDPAPAGCVGGTEDVLTVPPTLIVDAAVPEAVCVEAGDRAVEISGQGFLELDGVGPTVTLGGEVFAGVLGDCAAFDWPGHDARACTRLSVDVPQGSLPAGDTPVRVANPDPSGCGETAEGIFFIVPEPEIDAIAPAEVCEDDVETFVITGRNFSPVSTVRLDAVAATAVRFISAERLEADFAAGLDPGSYDLVVSNADGCVDSAPAAVTVHPTPAVFFVDPPIAYNGINLQVTIYTTGLDAAPRSVALLGPNDEEVILPDARPTPDRPNKLLATVPAGLAVGEWTVKVESRLGCLGQLPGALAVTDDLRVGVSAVEPGFLSPSVATAVTVRAEPAAELVGFASTPRAYLNPADGVDGALATALRAVVFVDDETLTAVAPAGLQPGAYDLVVVNPDATVGVLEGAVTVTVGEPPVIDGVEPASLDGNGPQVARVFGGSFDPAGVEVSMICRAPDGSVGEAPAPVVAGSLQATSVEARFPADQFPAGSVCVVTLANSDGARSSYSALSIKTPAQNLNDWQAAPELTTPRRALGLAAGRPTRTSRFVYAIGGDTGAVDAAHASIEAASVGIFGDLSAWQPQRNALPAPRTFASARRMGDFIYLIGGNDGAGPVDTVLRARILDPLAGPEVVDLSLVLEDDQPGLGAGLWHYRVSAVFPADDIDNPNGESLPGEVTVVQMPAVDGLRLTLEWEPVPGATGYRVYRTAVADDPVDTVALLAEVVEPRFVDDGQGVVGDATPLPPGSLGVWHVASTLTTPREAAAIATVADETGGWLYAFGGRDLNGALDSYEMARVDAEGRVGPFMAGAIALSTARAEGQVMQMTRADAAVIPAGETWLFVGPGRTDGGFSRNIDAALIEPDGSISAFIATDPVNGDYAGYGAGAANGFLFVFGGRGGAATDGGISAELCSPGAPGCGQAPAEHPDLRNWNALGVSLIAPRVYMGSTQESAFFFVAGGWNGVEALTAVEQTVQ